MQHTTDSKYEALFTPWKIGNVEIKKHPLTLLQQNAVDTIAGKDETFLLIFSVVLYALTG